MLPLQLVWKLSDDKTNMELKKKVTKENAVENSVMVDFSSSPSSSSKKRSS